jgi:hypothetical protein
MQDCNYIGNVLDRDIWEQKTGGSGRLYAFNYSLYILNDEKPKIILKRVC